MVENKLYGFLFFMVTMMANHMVAMEAEHNLGFFIANPFDKKKEDDIQLTLDSSVVQENDFFAENAKEPDSISVKGQNDLASVSHLSGIAYSPKRQLAKSRKKTIKRYADVLEKNEKGEFECPYNCSYEYAHKDGRVVALHIKRRHDPGFDLQTFDLKTVDLNAWIPRKQEKRYADVFEKNERGEFECPYNCSDDYTHERGDLVGQHIRVRHDKGFNPQTFDPDEADLDAWIPRKKAGRKKRCEDVFNKNEKGEFECPYNCRDEYTNKKGKDVVRHIKTRHDKDFDLYKFDPSEVDLNVWIPQQCNGGRKRKRKTGGTKSRLKKKRKLKI